MAAALTGFVLTMSSRGEATSEGTDGGADTCAVAIAASSKAAGPIARRAVTSRTAPAATREAEHCAVGGFCYTRN